MLEQPTGLLTNEKSLHEFCRLIARLKSNAQLHELIRIDNYPLFIERLFRFTIDHLLSVHHHRQYHLSPNTLHYILSYWSKIVAFLSHSSHLGDSDESPTLHLLDIYVPQIVCYYVQSRLDALNTDDVLYMELFDNDQTILQQQLEMISIMSRLDYKKTCALLCNCFDDIAQQYQQAVNSEAVERRFTFLIYTLGCVIGARGVSLSSLSVSSDDQDLFDGELVVRVLQLMTYIQQKTSGENNQNSINTAITTTTDKINSTPYSERLELAVLFFFEQFRRQYIGDHGRSNKIYQVLFKHLGNE
jgi:exportin-7